MHTPGFSYRFGAQADRLMSASMWCLGKDVQHAEGNLLERFGMRRVPRPPTHPGTSAYFAQISSESEIWLWGFGIFLKTPGLGCLFHRDSFLPHLFDGSLPRREVFDLEGLGVSRRAQSEADEGVVRLAQASWWRWLEGYEAWVVELLGPMYRQGLLKECRLPQGYQGPTLTHLWRHWVKCEWGESRPFPN